ncbi:MAG: serine protease [Bacteriovoracaceae bacterium]|nr:serine protease [Bacteriovoracaceae bacterium]
MKKSILVLLLFVTQAFATEKVIYGEDNRVDVYASTDNLHVELSKSTAAMINKSSLSKKLFSDEVGINGSSLKSRMRLCSDERFAEQMSAANCSGFLVGKDLLVTAGHCIRSQASCDKYRWVFDYKVNDKNQFKISVKKSSVFSCKKIIARSLTTIDGSKDDWALIKLDREVQDRKYLEVRQKGQPAVGTDLVVIGHPSGLPTKIADGAKVTLLDKNFFYADLDTYGGNSGSAVFNSATGVVEGILVRGATDYVSTSQGCRRSNVLAQGVKRSEGVSNISRLSQLILENR